VTSAGGGYENFIQNSRRRAAPRRGTNFRLTGRTLPAPGPRRRDGEYEWDSIIGIIVGKYYTTDVVATARQLRATISVNGPAVRSRVLTSSVARRSAKEVTVTYVSRLKDRRALVTGAAAGLARHAAPWHARDRSPHRAYVPDDAADASLRRSPARGGCGCRARRLSRRAVEVERALDALVRESGPFDTLSIA